MNTPPEAQLQAYVVALVRKAFPHEKAQDFSVETRFTLKLGRGGQEHNGAALWEAEGRADLLLFHDGRPLAVIELKRSDKALGEADLKQGQSYAGLLFPRPPLVIVSNGTETWVCDVESGEPIDGALDGAATIAAIFENVGKLAAANLSWAIETLMGPQMNVWIEAVRRRTDEWIDRLTGDPLNGRKPFPNGLLFHRAATLEVIEALDAGTLAVVVAGGPLAGKSNVLRELAIETRASADWALLTINAASNGPGLFQRIANLLGTALEWTLTADDVRTWLRRMSHSPGGRCWSSPLTG